MAGPLLNSAGSAEWEKGATPNAIKLVCSVNGPLEVKYRDELPQHASLEVVYRRNTGIPMIRERYVQDKLHSALLSIIRREFYPRSLIQIAVQVLDTCHDVDDSFYAEISEGINTACLAVIDAGVACSGLVSGVSYCILKNGSVVPILTAAGERKLQANDEIKSKHAVAFKHVANEPAKLVLLESSGEATDDEIIQLLEQAETDTQAVADEMRSRIEQSL